MTLFLVISLLIPKFSFHDGNWRSYKIYTIICEQMTDRQNDGHTFGIKVVHVSKTNIFKPFFIFYDGN